MSFSPMLIKALTNLGKKEVAKPLSEAFTGLAESATNGALDKLNEFISSAASPAMSIVTANITAALTPEKVALQQQFTDLLKDPSVDEAMTMLIDNLKILLPALTDILPPLIKMSAQIITLAGDVSNLERKMDRLAIALKLVEQFTVAWTEVLDYINSDDFQARSQKAWNDLIAALKSFWEWIKDLDGALEDVGNAFKWVKDKIQELKDLNMNDFFENFTDKLKNFWTGFVEGFSR